ncbi:MAG TPA: hydantoinase/oxoprolinase family protein [Solirubrobacterales bacterium]|nr:hydantoinase/oxoprolinase family protein [Solirubrobacterales bacterium]
MRLGIDIGGTFTDVVLEDDEGRLRSWKTPSTPPDFEHGVFAGIELAAAELGIEGRELLGRLDEFLHATTVTTNVVLTRAGSRVALLTTRGFGDLYQLARMYRNQERDPAKVTHPVPLVPRSDVAEVLERVDYRGRVVVPIDEDGLREAVRAAVAEGISSFAVCFLWSFRNPEHEQAARRAILEEAPGAFVAISSEAAPLIGEYERMSTTVITAFAGPELRAYTGKLLGGLRERGFEGQLLLMKSDGGLGSIEGTVASAGQTIYSGPVAGAMASRALGEERGDGNLITFDMGGTSTDVALVEDGEMHVTSLQFLDRQALATTMVDVTTVGAGGGSLATVGPDGTLRVGPESAGARPGPACYGRGGSEPTVTDANLVLGLLDPEFFLGGEMRLDREAGERAIAGLAGRLGMEPVAAAIGVFRVVNALMADAVRLRTVFAGLDPRGFSLVSYGGAGGLHCAAVARELGIGRVVVPAFASVFSASGLISTDITYSVNRSTQRRLGPGGAIESGELAELNEVFAALEEQVGASLAVHEIGAERTDVRRSLEVSYGGQILNFEVELRGDGAPGEAELAAAVADFDSRYAATYGTGAAAPEAGYDVKACRVIGIGRVPRPPAHTARAGGDGGEPHPAGSRLALADDRDGALSEVAVYRATDLGPGSRLDGPALVEYPDSTILVPRDAAAAVDAAANLTIEVER